MSNATASEIYENARSRIVNSALGIALGMNSDTSILDASISIEGVVNRGAWNGSISTIGGSISIPVGYHNGEGKVTSPNINSNGIIRGVPTISDYANGNTKCWVDLSQYYENYQNLTVDDIFVEFLSSMQGTNDRTHTIVKSYNSSTGILLISAGQQIAGNERNTEERYRFSPFINIGILDNTTEILKQYSSLVVKSVSSGYDGSYIEITDLPENITLSDIVVEMESWTSYGLYDYSQIRYNLSNGTLRVYGNNYEANRLKAGTTVYNITVLGLKK